MRRIYLIDQAIREQRPFARVKEKYIKVISTPAFAFDMVMQHILKTREAYYF